MGWGAGRIMARLSSRFRRRKMRIFMIGRGLQVSRSMSIRYQTIRLKDWQSNKPVRASSLTGTTRASNKTIAPPLDPTKTTRTLSSNQRHTTPTKSSIKDCSPPPEKKFKPCQRQPTVTSSSLRDWISWCSNCAGRPWSSRPHNPK